MPERYLLNRIKSKTRNPQLTMHYLPDMLHINTASPLPPEARLLVLYTGGTVGMVQNENQNLVPFNFSEILDRVPELKQFNFHIDIAQLSEPIDSSNISPGHWVLIGEQIERHYPHYDGFVVLHGTDTMAYTASALSFMLQHLAKPVVFTGAQVPIGRFRTDARYNLITALEVAGARKNGLPCIPEVCICFGNFVLRGNRAKKVESSHFDAFKSENYPALAEAGVDMDYYPNYIARPRASAGLRAIKTLEERVVILKLFPGLTEQLVRSLLLQTDLKGVVLETYGSGNAPTLPWFLDVLKEALARGVYILNVRQCDEGRVDQGKYETSAYLKEIGVIGGGDITAEAAVTKLMVVLGQQLPPAQTRRLLASSLAGEMS